MTSKPIGSLNGPWALLLKITLVCVPICGTVFTAVAIPWVRWQTENAYRTDELFERTKILEQDGKQNITDHAEIKISLGRIEAKLGVIASSSVGSN